jgi:hypothetical protein
MKRHAHYAFIAATFLNMACKSTSDASNNSSSGTAMVCPPGQTPQTVIAPGQSLTGEAIGKALMPTCGSCHAAGTSKPFFASGTAFEELILRAPAYVTPGKPDESDFYRLLVGTGTHAYKQMPPSGPAYAELTKNKPEAVSVQQIYSFITALTPESVAKSANAFADEKASTMRRVSARQIQASLKAQLGLTDADFLGHPEFLPIRDADGAGPPESDLKQERWHSLGGGEVTASRQADKNAGAQMMVTVNQMAMAWCRVSVTKPKSPLFKYAPAISTSKTDASAVQKNISYLYSTMLGLPEKPAEVAQLYALFLAVEAKGSAPAWISVCAALVRHPLWISY